MTDKKIVIGRNEAVELARIKRKVPAKIDTGADTSSIWVSNIRVDKNGILRFNLFGPDSPYFTGKVMKRERYKVAVVRSASGHEQLRYRTEISLRIAGKRIRAMFNLSDRSKNVFPILIGRRTLKGKFIVDVSLSHYSEEPSKEKTQEMNELLEQGRYEFFKNHYRKTGLSIKEKV